MLGAVLAFASAAFFGLNNATARSGVLKGSVLQGLAITVPLGVPFFLALAYVLNGFQAMASWMAASWIWMALAGISNFVVGRYGNYRATQALGGTLSTPIQQLSILVALGLAFIFLGEAVDTVNIIGIALVTIGPFIVARRSGMEPKTGKGGGFRPQYMSGVFWGMICAIAYGTSPLLISLGLGHEHALADSAAGVLVSYMAASAVVLVLLVFAGGRGYMATLDRRSGYWFLVTTVLVALSQFLRYEALALAPIAVVVPIQRLSVVFRLIFNALINRDHEVFDRWVIISIFLAVLGAVAISFNTKDLLSTLFIPQHLQQYLSRPVL